MTELRSLLSFVEALARRCGQEASAFFGRQISQRKEDGSLVTETDKALDRIITGAIRERFPQHGILSEEQSTLYDPSRDFVWVVDPIDGTTNFTRGLPLWGVSIGLLQQGSPVMGVIHFPLLQSTYTAIKGSGAFLNGAQIHTSSVTEPDDQQLMVICARTARQPALQTQLKPRSMGSATYHLCKLADGSVLAMVEATPKVWDIAAGLLVLSEAGGMALSPTGSPHFPLEPLHSDYNGRAMPLIAACNAAIMLHMQQAAQRV